MSDVKAVSEEKAMLEVEEISEDELPKEADISEEADIAEEEACCGLYQGSYWNEYGTLHEIYGKKLETVEYTVPLKKINIKARVNGSEVEICVEQRYLNPIQRTLKDVSFYYAIGKKEKLVEVQVNVDGKIFKDDSPYNDKVTLMKMKIGELKQKAEVISTVKYVTEACFNHDNWSTRLVIPTTLVPDKQAPERFVVDDMRGDRSFNPYVKIPMEIEVAGLMKANVKYISSPSHFIKSTEQNPSDGRITVMTSLPGTDPTEIERDVIVDIDWRSPDEAKEILTSLQVPDFESNHPLKQVYIKGRVINFIVEMCTKLRYLNESKEPVTVSCHRFPVEIGAAVVEFTAKIDGKWVKTEIEDRVKAKQEMQEAETPAILLEQLNQDTLGISINNLKPNTEVIVTIKYVIELPFNMPWVPESSNERSTILGWSGPKKNVNGAVTRLIIPATIFPAVPLKMEIITIMDNGIKSISSPSHKIRSEKQDCFPKETFVMKTSLSGKRMKQTDSDIILLVECDNPKKPLVLVDHSLNSKEEGTAVAVSFVPCFDVQQAPKEIIFVADKSDLTIKESEKKRRYFGFVADATDPVQRLIYSFVMVGRGYRKPHLIITQNSFFNAVGFGKFSAAVFPNGSEVYCKETIKKAFGIFQLYPAMGAKNLDGALEHILQQSSKNGLPRQIILFIRGEIENAEFILDLVQQHSHNTTVFCVGMGDEVSKSFVKDVALAGGGTSHFITSYDETESVLMQLSKDAFLPDLKEIKVSWKDETGKVSNDWDKFNDTENVATITPSDKGDRLLAYGKFVASRVPTSLTVDCPKSSSKDVVKIPEAENCKLSANILHKLIARKLIRELEKREIWGEGVKDKIAKLALKYQLLSEFTSFVGKKTFSDG